MYPYFLFAAIHHLKSSPTFSVRPCSSVGRVTEDLIPNFFFSLKRIYLLFEILLRKNFLIWINPRFSAPRRNLENSSKTPPCCCTTESEENGSSSCYDVYPGRSNISCPLISLCMMQNIFLISIHLKLFTA